MKNVFNESEAAELITRINKLTPFSKAQWGKMDVAQMLAHCNVTYELIYDNIHKKPGPLMKLMLKLMVKKTVVNELAYKQNNPTAPAFLIKDKRDFEKEKNRLIAYIKKTRELGEKHFEGKESHSFGKLNKSEWNNMMYKHLDHHLKQFGA